MGLWLTILSCLYFLLPAGFANMAPVFAKNIKFLNYPVDFGLKLRGKRLFGKNKTWRGVVAGVILAIFVIEIQHILLRFEIFGTISLLDYESKAVNYLLIGFLLGFGAMLGDLIESFIKRQIGIKPGERFIFFDQTDWVIGALSLSSIYLFLEWEVWTICIIGMFILHIIIKHIGYYTGLEDKKW